MGGQRWWAIAFLVARLHCLVLYDNIVFVFLANKYSLSLSLLYTVDCWKVLISWFWSMVCSAWEWIRAMFWS